MLTQQLVQIAPSSSNWLENFFPLEQEGSISLREISSILEDALRRVTVPLVGLISPEVIRGGNDLKLNLAVLKNCTSRLQQSLSNVLDFLPVELKISPFDRILSPEEVFTFYKKFFERRRFTEIYILPDGDKDLIKRIEDELDVNKFIFSSGVYKQVLVDLKIAAAR